MILKRIFVSAIAAVVLCAAALFGFSSPATVTAKAAPNNEAESESVIVDDTDGETEVTPDVPNDGQNGEDQTGEESSSESESEGRFVDKASQWLEENLSVKVSSATIGTVIIVGVLILIFKRK